MKKWIACWVVCMFALSVVPAYAAPEGRKGASDQALENADENAVFHRIPDWFATVGKSDEEKEQILAERKAERARKRLEKQAEKQKKEAEKQKKNAEKKMKEGKQEAQKAQTGLKDKAKKMGA